MDITVEQGKSSTLGKECTSSHPSEHIIPQMIITSADDTYEEQQNVSECTLVLIPPSTNNSSVEIENKNILEESKKSRESSNAVSGKKPDVDFEDISIVVNDVISKCTETVSHSTIQRPLVIEVEKSTPKQEVGHQDSSVRCPTPPPPPPPIITSPSAMQRPLVFEGVVKTEAVAIVDTEKKDLTDTLAMQDELNSDIAVGDETIPERIKPSSPTKKDGLHGVKKFFDSLLHSDSQNLVPESDEVTRGKESVIPTDLTKSEKSSGKKISDTLKPTQEKEKVQTSQSPETVPSLCKESTTFAQDAKQSIKAFFDTFKHEPSEPVDKREIQMKVTQPDTPKEYNEVVVEPASLEHQKEGKTSASFAKDTKQNIKAFFDNIKHQHSDEHPKSSKKSENKELNVSLESSEISKEKEKSAKDKKQNIKSFFDSFKPEANQSKQKDNKEKITDTKLPQQIGQKQSYEESLKPHEKKESASVVEETTKSAKSKELGSLEISIEKEKSPKDKKGIKSFFDSFKHDTGQSRQKDHQEKVLERKLALEDESVQKQDFDKALGKTESVYGVEDSRKNIKPKELNVSIDPPEISKEKVKSPKDKKQNIKSFFDSLKHETSETKQKEDQVKTVELKLQTEKDSVPKQSTDKSSVTHEENKESTSFVKETKQNIKSFFDTFKHDTSEQKSKETLKQTPTLSEPDLHKKSDPTISTKDAKRPLKKFFSFKHIGTEDIVEPSSCLEVKKEIVKDKPTKEAKSVKLDLKPTYSSNGFDIKAGSSSYINGHDKDIQIKERAQSVPSDSLERARNANILPEELNKKVGASSSILDSQTRPAEKDSLHGFKKFFESFKHEKSDIERSASVDYKTEKDIPTDVAVNDGTKCLEKPVKEKKSKGVKRSFSDKLNREEVVQNFKGFFDSISHRSSSKKAVKEQEHIYDTVEVKPEADIPVLLPPSNQTVEYTSSFAVNSERHKTKEEPSSAFHTQGSLFKPSTSSSDSSKKKLEKSKSYGGEIDAQKSSLITHSPQSSLIATKINIKNDTATDSDLSKTVSESPSSKPDKSSVLGSIGENILALKEKVLHGKEKRKSGIIDDSAKESDIAAKPTEVGIENSQHPPTVSISIVEQPNKENIDKIKPLISEKSSKSPSSPNTLYDTCCMKLAILLRDKAVDVVSKHTKSPPPKPPKPSAETIARARAAAVARRLEAKRLASSIGDNIPIGFDGMRFADDDTESSCDYKDVENFDYIMDYELINRYKLDSSKLDTFSVPSTCSGMTSYYTADSVTLRDENFSDAAMETVSLSSDVSYCLKHFSSTGDIESKNIKSGRTFSTPMSKNLPGTKQSVVKKVPPPIPPKPLILQTLSKNKTTEMKVSERVNGLSLSPRLQRKDNVATLKRPLMVADIKETQFSSLQHPKSKNCPPKPARSFNTVLKNESLKTISDVSPVAQSSPNVSVHSLQHIPRTVTKSSEMPPEDSLLSSTKIEKRTKSPPRPPPPNLAKKPTPQRPPPPVKSLKDSDVEMKVQEKQVNLEHDIFKNELPEVEKIVNEESSFIHIPSAIESNQVSNSITVEAVNEIDHKQVDDVNALQETVLEVTNFDLNKHNDSLNNNVIVDIFDGLNNNSEIKTEIPIDIPKPPPRNRRIRSRTVEIVPLERCVERQKRSQSLSDIDVEKRVSFLTAEKPDTKSLYTTINKDGKKLNSDKTVASSSPDLVSGRPLPPPPPPPRKFRSLERKKPKDAEKRTDEQADKLSEGTDGTVKPPARRRKTEKQRFFSLHTDHRRQSASPVENSKRTSSLPIKPNRKAKSFSGEKYDVNANISVNESPHKSFDSSTPDIPGIDRTDSQNTHKDSSERTKSHSSWYDENDESWETVDSAHFPEFCDQPKVPARRKSEAKRKSQQTSKFYVNMDEEPSVQHPVHKEISSLQLVDKETSPLPLDCSEKSVQTSLETLSQGIVSHDDEQSEDTDELLDLAQTLQKELSTIINRHKLVDDSTEEASSPSLSAATSEKNLAEGHKKLKMTSSMMSSTSDVWPLSSSDESDAEREGEDSSNINEIAVKKKQKKIFYIAQEIMSSEEVFVDALKLLNVDFKAAVEVASKQRNMCIIPDEALSQILNHLPQLQHLNENLLMELKDRIENWEKCEKISDIIVKMGPFLKLYSWYIHDFESTVSLLEDCKKKYPAFAQVVKEFEMSPRCKRLSLNHYMLKPIQRIPQYRLLLQEYLHRLSENSKDYQDTVAALQIVSEVANHANDSMKLGDNAQKLISIQNSIMGHKEIVKPGRLFVKEGELMKLSRKGMQPRWFVLFNDLLLYLTPVQPGLYRVNHELPLTGMKVAIPIQQDYQNEFSIISVTRSFTLAARSPEERQEWIIALTKAIEENASKRSTFTNTRLHQKAQDKTSSEDEGAFVLGKKAPVWIPDARVTMCQLCTSEFTVTFRRHHCRACGKVVCSICSSHRISLPYLGNRIARVCDECHTHLGQGSSACTESGETDSDNQQIAVKPHLRTDSRHVKKNKKSLPSVLKEVCANDQGSTISGYLHKRSGKSWKRDWFVVKDKVLYEYKASEDVAALKSFPLLGYQIELFSEPYENIESSLLFQLTHPGQAPIIFYTDSANATQRWVSALKTATVLE